MDFASAVFGGSLAFVRIASMVFTAPVLGHRSVPFRFKVLLALVLTTVTFPLISKSTTVPTEIDGWTQSLFAELAIGIFLGLGVQIVFAAAQMAGTVISQMAAMQIGGGSDTLGGAGSPVSKLLCVLSIAAFVLMSGPEQVVGATIDTFVAVPVGASLQTAGLIDLAIELLRQSFLLTLRGVAPAVGAILISTFVVGLISRNYPQINLLNMGLTSNLCVMILSLSFTLGGCVWLFADDFQQVVATIQNALVAEGDSDTVTLDRSREPNQANEFSAVTMQQSFDAHVSIMPTSQWRSNRPLQTSFAQANAPQTRIEATRFLPTDFVAFAGETQR